MAAGKATTDTWILLPDACERLGAAYGRALAEKRLSKGLKERTIHWQGLSEDGTVVNGDTPGFAGFWEQDPQIDWSEGSACEVVHHFYVIYPPSSSPSINEPGRIVYRVQLLLADVLALLPTAPAAGKKAAKDGPQMRRVKAALKNLYPPDGLVSDEVSTEIVRAQVAADLASDSRRRGVADPGWDTVRRALGRNK
jgi:hypothetical protein